VQFVSDATSIHLNYTLASANTTIWTNFAAIGTSGCDLFVGDASTGQWRWVASTFEGLEAARDGVVVESPLFTFTDGWPVGPMPSQPTNATTYSYRLHFPSYNGVLTASIGVPVGASIGPDLSWQLLPTVAYVGTSITQVRRACAGVVWCVSGWEWGGLAFCVSRAALPQATSPTSFTPSRFHGSARAGRPDRPAGTDVRGAPVARPASQRESAVRCDKRGEGRDWQRVTVQSPLLNPPPPP
jgi:hypothetical protein